MWLWAFPDRVERDIKQAIKPGTRMFHQCHKAMKERMGRGRLEKTPDRYCRTKRGSQDPQERQEVNQQKRDQQHLYPKQPWNSVPGQAASLAVQWVLLGVSTVRPC